MMLMPKILTNSLFDNWMGDFPAGKDFFENRGGAMMKTDVKESDEGFSLEVDLPGFRKEDIKAQLENGYMTISASRSADKEENDENGKYIRKERYEGSCSRCFYVGEGVTENDINAKFSDGILKMFIPKKTPEKIENKNYIAIEG